MVIYSFTLEHISYKKDIGTIQMIEGFLYKTECSGIMVNGKSYTKETFHLLENVIKFHWAKQKLLYG